MTLKGIIFFLLPIIVAFLPQAQADEVKMPSNKDFSKEQGYWYVKNLILDIDSGLNESGLQVRACTYRSNITKKDSSYKGLGPCLWSHFSESMETSDRETGVTYFWIDDSQVRPVEVHWRPPREGWDQWLGQAFEMTFEDSLYWWRSLSSKKRAEAVPYKEFLFGDIKLVFPNEEAVSKILEVKGNPWITNYLKNVNEIEVKISPSGRKKGAVVHSGVINAKRTLPDGQQESLTLAVETNLNVLALDRKFYLNVLKDAPDFGPMPGVTHVP